MQAPSSLTMPCPKCTTPMQTLERSGVHVEVCPDCRGIFLDRGEVDRLIDIEANAAPWGEPGHHQDRGGRRGRTRGGGPGDRWEPAWDGDEPGSAGRGGRRRSRGFLGDLLEGFGD